MYTITRVSKVYGHDRESNEKDKSKIKTFKHNDRVVRYSGSLCKYNVTKIKDCM